MAAGAAVAVQSRINGELGARLADGIAAATVSFGTGMIVLILLVPTHPAGRRSLAAVWQAVRGGALRPWQCLGGVCGAYLVVTQGAIVPSLGVAIYTIAVVAGQSGSSLLVDRAGVGPSGPQPVTAGRLAGALLAVVAMVVTVGDRLTGGQQSLLVALPALAGVAIAWQQAVNGRVRVAAGAALPAAFVNFATGTTALLLAFAVDWAARGWPTGSLPRQPWLYLGGPLGVVFIALAAALVRLTGVLLLALGMIAGQVIGAIGVDLLVPDSGTGRPGARALTGAGLTLVAVVVAAFSSRDRPAPVGTAR